MDISETTAGKHYIEIMGIGKHYAGQKIMGISAYMDAAKAGAVEVVTGEYGFHQRTTYADGSSLIIWNDTHKTTVFVVVDGVQYCINYQGAWVAFGHMRW